MSAPAPANRVRTEPTCIRAGRVVQVRFTDFARIPGRPGLLTMFGPAPDQAVQDLLRRLGVSAAAIQPRAQQLGDVAILRRIPADAPPEFKPGTVQPVAFVEGLTQHEIAESLSWLAQPAAA